MEMYDDQQTADLAVASTNRKQSSAEEGQLTVDVYRTDDDVVIKSTIAGVTPDDIDVSITNDMVTIRGKRMPDEKISPSSYDYQELYWGPFSRTIILPEEIDAEKASASMKNGILTLRLPKMAKSRVKRIRVSS